MDNAQQQLQQAVGIIQHLEHQLVLAHSELTVLRKLVRAQNEAQISDEAMAVVEQVMQKQEVIVDSEQKRPRGWTPVLIKGDKS